MDHDHDSVVNRVVAIREVTFAIQKVTADAPSAAIVFADIYRGAVNSDVSSVEFQGCPWEADRYLFAFLAGTLLRCCRVTGVNWRCFYSR